MTKNGKIISIFSGKSQVGKTQIALNLSLALLQQDQNVLLVDMNILSSMLHFMLGVEPSQSLYHVFEQGKALHEVIETHSNGLDLVYGMPRTSGDISQPKISLETLVEQIKNLTQYYDYIILDQAAGLSEFIQLAPTFTNLSIVVTTPEPEAVSDAYALIKVLSESFPTHHFKTIVNWVKSEKEAIEVFDRFYLVVEHFLQSDVELLGYLLEDKHVFHAIENQIPFLQCMPQGKAAKCIQQIAKQVVG